MISSKFIVHGFAFIANSPCPYRLTDCSGSWIPFSFRLGNKEESEGFIYATDSRSKGGFKLTPFPIMGANHYHN